MQITRPLLVAAVLAASLPAGAAGPDDGYLDLVPYFTRVDGERDTDPDALGLRAAYGWGYEGPWYNEVQIFGAILETNESEMTDFYMSGIGFDVAYNFGDRQWYTPYLLAGVGIARNDVIPDVDDQTEGFVNFAAGFTTEEISRRGIRLRAEVRYLHDFFQGGRNDWQLGFGVSIPLRCPPPPVVAMAPPPPPERGPVEVKMADSDGDGVFDRDDRCPDTLPGAQVDSEGCVIADQTITLEAVRFELNSDRLTPGARDELLTTVRALRSQPGTAVEIAGHTDSLGNDNYNLRLSQKRANSVRAFLISNGIDAGRITANGYGEQQPVASNDTEAGRALNRRVEMRFR
ncbi:OmpA family protein [Microbulbifer yueqingensis]|uniref:OmpA-OmpF porin, OOP family n=1 Tax=Microbulbifer yueqingensis TaxID=658219 RepID=A0A1G8UYT2_9GAMM|nr:OmpA family protein [Microbulbifer yueqingensis]SDJ58747.1 OmpA-OmpF porin, OOP family [Microbulbifer yueqingensis]